MSRTITLYPFSELTEEAKEKALKDFMESTQWMTWHDDFISEDITEMSIQTLEEAGYNVRSNTKGKRTYHELEWSCSYCQGDGFTWGADIDIKVIAKRLLTEDEFTLVESMLPNINARTDKGRSCSCSPSLDFEDENPEPETGFDMVLLELRKSIIKKLEEAIKEDISDMESQLSKEGYAEIEHQQGEENCKETLENNDHIEFEEDGTYVP